ncbi:MAG: hypothetical protein KatS3mg110_0391 [Pirellulaceae bacterium]|nr:MAG: hypothetical protein KatS3mg110_0391 [Pirellulaceae bacterium]
MTKYGGAWAWRNGEWIPAEELTVSPLDAGFVLGATVAEQLRTFRGQLFRLEDHLRRLARSLQIAGIVPVVPLEKLREVCVELVERNRRGMHPGDDLGLTIFVTPGPYSTYVPEGGPPLMAMHTYPLPFRNWAHLYRSGQSVWISSIRQVPASCWPPELKCRSRMHYYLADREARSQQPGARAVLLDQDGFVSEASTANVVLSVSGEGLVSPPREAILPGISIQVLRELAEALGIPFHFRPVRPEELQQADEAFLTSTSPCLVPVTFCNGKPVGRGEPGAVFEKLITEWGSLVGVDIRRQAEEFAYRR